MQCHSHGSVILICVVKVHSWSDLLLSPKHIPCISTMLRLPWSYSNINLHIPNAKYYASCYYYFGPHKIHTALEITVWIPTLSLGKKRGDGWARILTRQQHGTRGDIPQCCMLAGGPDYLRLCPFEDVTRTSLSQLKSRKAVSNVADWSDVPCCQYTVVRLC